MIADRDAELPVLSLRAHGDRRSRRSVLDRVADEIAERLAQPPAIGGHRHRLRRCIEREPLLSLLGQDLVVRDDLAEERPHVEVLGLERDRALLEARHLEQVLGELLEPAHVPLGALGQLALAG